MDNSVESNDAIVSFKIELEIIPETDIQRSGKCPVFRGGFCDIWKCYMSTQSEARPVAVRSIRVLPLTDDRKLQAIGKRIRREAYVLIQLSHDNILPLEGVTVAKEFGPLPAFVSPWMEEGTLDDYLKWEVGLSWERKLSMVRDVAAGLQYLHDKDIVHGDLTDTNVLVCNDGRLCIAYYGLSTILADSGNATFNSCHPNIRWMPPETIQSIEEERKPTMAADVYSYGCVMMQVFSGHQPYARITNVLAIMGAQRKGRKPFSELDGISEEIQQFAQLCLSGDIDCRPSVGKIVEFLQSQINDAKTMETMPSHFPVLANQIPQAVLMKCDNHPDDLDVLGEALKCKWVVHGSSDIEVAVKTLGNNVNSQDDVDRILNRLRREIYVRRKLRHGSILAFYGMTEGFGVLPSFVYPWMAGGSLHGYLKREYSDLPARRKLDILVQVADGIKYLHKQDIVHGNLTGDNLLLDASGRIRIADFSRSVILAEANSRIFSEQLPGDARYVSPERIGHDDHTGAPKLTKAGDVYSYGCVAILVLSGKVPYWWIPEESQVLVEKGRGTEPFLPNVEVDGMLLNLLKQCLLAKRSRPSIEKVLYLVLVQNFGAVDLTGSIQPLSEDHRDFGGFAYVHTCKIRLIDIDASVRKKVSRYYQRDSMTDCVDVAVKEQILANDPDTFKIINQLFREIKLWLKLEHENIVPLWGVTDGFGSLPGLVSPWVENGSLTEYLQHKHEALFEDEKFALLGDVARGLQYLHSQLIVHGDLSGRTNVLVHKNGKASLTDFGLSAFLPGRMSQALLPTNPTCTAQYMAPEYLILDDEGNMAPDFSSKSDVYSFGGIMLQVLEGKVPYYYVARYESIIRLILKGIRPKKPPASVVIDTDWDFIQRCWLEDAKCRPSAGDILGFLEGRAAIRS